ncbi:MAG: lipoyl(octanoyl) transferase LipB [Cyclobacteriaceae bacterium]
MNSQINRQVKFIDLGLIEFEEAWKYQTTLFDQILEIKKSNRNLPSEEQKPTNNYLIFCEHAHVYTLGKSGDKKNLLISDQKLKELGATYHHINRGGDITYHGPGQIVVYPVIDMENFFTDIHKYMRLLEESVIQVLTDLGLPSGRISGLTGVWIEPENTFASRKISALGVKTSRWVSLHGLAFNVNTDLSFFDHIVPCGIDDKAVTSLQKEMGTPQDMEKIKSALRKKIASLFDMTLLN